MNEPIQEHYSKRENCLREVGEARQTWGNRNITEKQWEAIDRSLGLMYLYCPDDLRDLVWATMLESTKRQSMMALMPLRNC